MPKSSLLRFGHILSVLTLDQRRIFIDLILELHRKNQVQADSGNDCDICLPSANGYWQANFGENWQAAKDAYCAELECNW